MRTITAGMNNISADQSVMHFTSPTKVTHNSAGTPIMLRVGASSTSTDNPVTITNNRFEIGELDEESTGSYAIAVGGGELIQF